MSVSCCNRACKCVISRHLPALVHYGAHFVVLSAGDKKVGGDCVMISHHIAHHHHWLIITRGQSHLLKSTFFSENRLCMYRVSQKKTWLSPGLFKPKMEGPSGAFLGPMRKLRT